MLHVVKYLFQSRHTTFLKWHIGTFVKRKFVLKHRSFLKSLYFEFVWGRNREPYCTHRLVSKIKSWCWPHKSLGINIIFYPKKIVISKKKFLLESNLRFPNFCPEVIVFSKKGHHLKLEIPGHIG